MNRCAEAGCIRARITDGSRCEQHTRQMQTQAFAPEWVRRARENRLPAQTTQPPR